VIETEHDALCETYLHRRLRSHRLSDGDAREFFAVAADELRDGIEDVREFLAEFVPKQQEAERLGKQPSDDRLLQPGDREWEMWRRLVAAREVEAVAKFDRARLETDLKLAIGTAAGIEGVATWRTETQQFDEAGFRRVEPELYETYRQDVRLRRFLLR
jgi:hypothetical protein